MTGEDKLQRLESDIQHVKDALNAHKELAILRHQSEREARELASTDRYQPSLVRDERVPRRELGRSRQVHHA
jgi:hypothetical protein